MMREDHKIPTDADNLHPAAGAMHVAETNCKHTDQTIQKTLKEQKSAQTKK